nr:MAG TPA: hypothetical protein [Caudoviricetes sp.]
MKLKSNDFYNKKSFILSKFDDSEHEASGKKDFFKRCYLLKSFLVPILSKKRYKNNDCNK